MRQTLLTFILVIWPSLLSAEVYELSLDADVCAIKTALSGQVPQGCQPGVDLGTARSVTAASKMVASQPKDARSGYFIHFGFDSDRLTPAYRRHLETLSLALNSDDMAGLCLRLVGHTDAVGSTQYNQQLPERRAKTVRHFLVRELSLSAARFTVAGQGELALLAGHAPSDARHRRVEILAKPAAGGCDSS